MDLLQFVPEHLLILVVGLYVIGVFLKQTPVVKDWMIPWVLLIVGIVCSVALQRGLTAIAFIQGIVCTGAAVLSNQLWKQTKEKREE